MSDLKMLAVDIGASSGRGIVGSFDGERLSLSETHRFPNDPVMVGGTFRWDILRLFHEVKQAVRNTALAGHTAAGMGIDTWGVDFGLLNGRGELLANPVHYRDLRTANMTKEAEPILPAAELYGLTGIQQINFNTVYQLMAQKRDDPELLHMAKKLLFIPDLLNYFLTGVAETEYTIASTGALLNAKTGKTALELFEKIGVPVLFDELSMPGSKVGRFTDAVREELGVDIPVYHVASHDTACAVIAVPAREEDFVYISSGTWSLMGTELKAPLLGEECRRLNFTNEGGAGGTVRFLKNIMGLWILQESRRQWRREGKEYSFDELQKLALAEKPLCSFIDPDDEMFAIPGDMPRRIAEYCRKTGQTVPETVGQTVRTILESLAFRYRQTAQGIAWLRQRPAGAIHIVGGGAKDDLLCRLTADACGIPVVAGPVEATAVGNLCMQYIGHGALKDLEEARELVRRSFDTVRYEPAARREAYEEAYVRFLGICR